MDLERKGMGIFDGKKDLGKFIEELKISDDKEKLDLFDALQDSDDPKIKEAIKNNDIQALKEAI